jgi:uncharacterized membrane protein
MNIHNKLPKNIRQTQLALLLSYYALLFYFLVSAFMVFGELRVASIVIWLIQAAPLAIFVRGLHRAHLRTYAWVCFVILLYFMHGVLIAFEPQRFWFGLIEVVLCTLIFFLLIVFIRLYRTHYQVPL